MLQRIRVSIYRWLALRRFPKGVPQSSYLYFDYFVPYGGFHERVMIYEYRGVFFLYLESGGSICDKDTKLRRKLPAKAVEHFFVWLRDRFGNGASILKSQIRRDPAQLSLFAFDVNRNWKVSICIYDVHLCDELLSVRREIMEKVNQLASCADVDSLNDSS